MWISAVTYRDIQQAGADVLIGNHTAYDGNIAKTAALAKRRPGDPNPYADREGRRQPLPDRGRRMCAGGTGAVIEADPERVGLHSLSPGPES